MLKCGFIGHRDSCNIEEKIFIEIEKLIENENIEFYSGGMGNFDKMCERIVKGLNKKLIFVPYNMKQIKIKDELWYDEIICPFGEKEYSKYDIPNRNKWIVDNCNILLCYVHKEGGAKNTLNYAILKNKKVINILL